MSGAIHFFSQSPCLMSWSDYSVFASPTFDPNDYANAILAGESYPPQFGVKVALKHASNSTKSALQDSIAKEDLSVEIAKLTIGIDDVSKQIRNLVGLQEALICSCFSKF